MQEKGLKTWFIKPIMLFGAFGNLNGNIGHSYNPSIVLNAVFHPSLGQILI